MLSGDDVAVVEKWVHHGSTWSFLLSLKKQVSPGGLPIDETGNDWQLTSSPQRIVVVTRSDQRILAMEHFIVDNISSGSVEEVLETIPPKSVHILSLLKNFVKKQHGEVNFRRGTWDVFFPKPLPHQANHRQLNDTIFPCTVFFFRIEEVFAHNQSDRILLRYH